MMRTLTGMAAGPLLASILLLALEAWISGLYPLPAGHDPHDPDALGAWISSLPVYIVGLWLLGWGVAAALGAVMAIAVSGRGWVGLIAGLALIIPASLVALVVLDPGILPAILVVMPAAGAAVGILTAHGIMAH